MPARSAPLGAVVSDVYPKVTAVTDRQITSPRDPEHLAELIRLVVAASDADGHLVEMRPGTFLMSASSLNIWLRVTESPIPSIALSVCVFDFSVSPGSVDRNQQIVQLATERHDHSGSTSTTLTLVREALWLSDRMPATAFDPQELQKRTGSFTQVALRVVEPVQWRFNGPGLLDLAPRDDREPRSKA